MAGCSAVTVIMADAGVVDGGPVTTHRVNGTVVPAARIETRRVGPLAAQIALGQAMQARAGEIAAAVVVDWSGRAAPVRMSHQDAVGIVTRTCTLGTEIIARYLCTGEGVRPEEKRELAAAAELSAVDEFDLTDHAKNYLAWRDATMRALRVESARLGVDQGILNAARRVVRRSCDASLIEMVKEFDVQRRHLRVRLDAERMKLAQLALRDPLTGLANRTALMDRLAHALSRRVRHGGQVAVLFLDLDGFKGVNDSLGHEAGDRLLKAVGTCLTGLIRPADTVARLGGDEFVVLCEDLPGGEAGIGTLVQRIRAGIANCCPTGDLAIAVSIGVALATAGADPDEMLARADTAMYAAKKGGRGRAIPRGAVASTIRSV